MFNMNHYIAIFDGKEYIPAPYISEINIEKSVKNLADTATITAPIMVLNKFITFHDSFNDEGNSEKRLYKLYKRGQKIKIYLGYNDNVELEFSGYIKEVKTNDGEMKIECEDALFIFRKSVPDKQFKPATVKQIAQYLVDHIDKSYTVVCNYDILYDKFTIYQANAYDVLAKLQEDTGADIFFDMAKKELHIHPAYTRKGGETDYSYQVNIEEGASLEWKPADDKKVEVTIESVGLDGKTISTTVGKAGGEKITKKVGRMSKDAIKLIADQEYKNKTQAGYEGSFDTWLIPYVEPSFTIGIYDDDYPDKDGRYYCESVKTTFSESGGKRTITPGIKLS